MSPRTRVPVGKSTMPTTKPTLNYSTRISAVTTVGECQSMLGRHGASHVGVAYEDGIPAGLSFALKTPHGVRSFTMPVNVDGVAALLKQQVASGNAPHMKRDVLLSRDHAARVAWRVVKDWLEAQLAMIDAHMATLDQVMLPYLHVDGDKTLFQAYQEREQAALTAGS